MLQMTAIKWKSGANGNWNVASDWSTGAVPTSVDTVTVSAAGTYTVSITDSEVAKSLTLGSTSATISDTGMLTLAGALTLTAGTFTLQSSGILAHATIVSAGGTLVSAGGTLSSDTYHGTLDLSGSNATVNVAGSLALASASGSGTGSIALTGYNSQLYIQSSMTLNNATISIGNAGTWDYLDVTASATTLTLGPSLTLQQSATYANLYANSSSDEIVNKGIINAGVAAGQFVTNTGTFVNQGTISISNGDTFSTTKSTFSNSGTIVETNGVLTLGTWSNAGVIEISGGELALTGPVTSAQFETISFSNGASLAVSGAFNDSGGTLTTGPSSALGTVSLAGTITSGTIVDGTGIGFVAQGGTLAGVSYQGTLNLSASGATLDVLNGLTLAGNGGPGAGAILLTGYDSRLYVGSSMTLNNANVSVGNASYWTYLDVVSSGTTLTLGPSLDINQVGADAQLSANYTNDSIINQGTITADLSGGQFITNAGTFSNSGLIAISNNETFSTTNGVFANSGTVSVDGGTLSLGTWGNTGVFDVVNSSLSLGGSFTQAQFASISFLGGDTLSIEGAFTDTSGTLTIGGEGLGPVSLSGTITGGVIVDVYGSLGLSQGGTLVNVSYEGTLNLGAANAIINLSSGFSLSGNDGVGAGTVLLTGDNSRVYVDSSLTIDNGTILVGNNSGSNYLDAYTSGTTLTLGPNLSVVQTGTYSQFYANYSNDVIVNEGTITAGLEGGQFLTNTGTFINQGSIDISNGDSFSTTNGVFSNSGTVLLTGGTLSLGTWSNTGIIDAFGGLLALSGTITQAQFASLTFGGASLGITGVLNDNGGTLSIGSGGGPDSVSLSGTIASGLIIDNTGGLDASGYIAQLVNVSYQGTINLSATNVVLNLSGGFTFSGIGGSGNGSILLTGNNTSLYVNSSMTLNNDNVQFGNDSYWSYLVLNNSATTLTLGSSSSIMQSGTYAQLVGHGANDTIINQGTIAASFSGGQFLTNSGTFTNQGFISVSNGSTFNLNNSVFTNLSSGTLLGGAFLVGAASYLQLQNNASIVNDSSSLTLTGVGAEVGSYNTGTNSNVYIDSTLQQITSTGTLALLAGRNFTATADSGTLTDYGNLVLGDSIFTANELLVSGGMITGSGSLDAILDVSGGATTTGGTLSLGASVTGTGVLSVAAGATLENVSGTISGTAAVSGTLSLDGGAFTSTSVAIAAGGTVTGFGSLGGSVTDHGSIDANGGTLSVATLAGLAGGTWSGGGLEADEGSTLLLAKNASIVKDAGTITLSGTASAIDWASSSGTALVTLESSLSSITTAGTLEILSNRSYTATAAGGTFAVAGALVLGGGTFAASALVLDAGAKLSGMGTITAPATISGATSITGGSLLLAGALSGASTLSIGSGAVVELAANGGFTGVLSDSGTLLLAGANLGTAKASVSATGSVYGFGTLGTVTNAGWLDATGGTLALGALTSLSSGTLTQGQLEADAGSVLQLAANTTVSTLLGSVTLSGLGSTIQALNTTSMVEVAVDTTLGSIGKTGALVISNGRTFVASSNAGTITDAGLLSIQSGSFSAQDLVVAATGTLLDNGAFSGAIANSGVISIADEIVLGLTSGGALGGSFTGPGTLQLSGATAYNFASTTSLAAGRILVSAGATLSGTGTVTGLLDVAGTLVASSGTLTIDGGFASDDPATGALSIAAGAVLDLDDGGAFSGIVQGAGSLVNADVISGSTNGASLAGTGTISVSNLAGGEIYAGTNDALLLSGTSNIVNNAGSIGGTRHGVVLSGTSNSITNIGLITGDIGAAIVARGSGATTIVNSGLIANYEGPGVAAISLNGAASATLTNAGTIIGGYYLTSGQSAIQFGAGNDRLIMDPGSVIVGTVRGGLGTNTLEMAALSGVIGTLSGLGTAFQAFSVVTEDAGANWQLAGANTLFGGATVSVGGTLALSGTLAASAGGTISGAGSLTLAAGSLLDVSAGATLSLAGANLTNLAAGTLTGGGFEVDGASTLLLATGAAVTTDDANIVLTGSGGKIAWLNAAGGTLVALGQSLASIGAAGTLSLQGSTFTASAALSDAGQISLAAGTLSAMTLTVASTGTVSGTGQIAGSLADQGLVAAVGGTLTLTGSISGAGTVGIGQDSTLVASGTLAGANVAFLSSGGLLDLGLPASMTGTIQDFATSDTIDLLKTVVTGDTFSNDTLTLTGASGTLAVLHFSGDYSGYQFAFTGDGHGGSEILLI